jgi:hypothetical protein
MRKKILKLNNEIKKSTEKLLKKTNELFKRFKKNSKEKSNLNINDIKLNKKNISPKKENIIKNNLKENDNNINLKFLKNSNNKDKKFNDRILINPDDNEDKKFKDRTLVYPDKEDNLLSNTLFDKNKRKKLLNLDKENKTILGGAIFAFIIIALIFSAYFFLIYTPYLSELEAAKIEKINELNILYTGPLSVNDDIITLKSMINRADTVEKVKIIDIIQPATISWRQYQNNEINNIKDIYARVMLKYSDNNSRNIIMPMNEGHTFVNSNDATVLSKINFLKPDTVIVPVLLSRLESGGGLMSIGDFVDIYFLSKTDYSNNDNNTDSNDSTEDSLSNQTNNYPSISGATVVAILRSKNSGVISGNYFDSNKSVDNNLSSIAENEKSFSIDVEEILKAAAAGGFDEAETKKLLSSFGLKLSDYERIANLAELDSQYLILLEIPRDDVNLLINNMDNIRITIPTNKAPTWVVDELKNVYASYKSVDITE